MGNDRGVVCLHIGSPDRHGFRFPIAIDPFIEQSLACRAICEPDEMELAPPVRRKATPIVRTRVYLPFIAGNPSYLPLVHIDYGKVPGVGAKNIPK